MTRSLLDSLDHAHAVAVLGVARELDLVHQLFHEKNAEPADGAPREGTVHARRSYFGSIEQLAEILDLDHELVAPPFALDEYFSIAASAISVLHYVRDGFVDGHVHILGLPFIEATRPRRLDNKIRDDAQIREFARDL